MVLLPFVFACPLRPATPAAPRVLVGAVESRGLPGFLAAHPLAPGQGLRADEVGRTAAASHHVVQVATAETPHRHRSHDLTVTVLEGEGVLHVEERALPMRAGDVAVVARGVPHWFARTGARTAVAFVVFTPPLDAPDTQPVEPLAPAAVDSAKGRR
ncbi:MAG: cupin domain-containing protein [bacterium]|nr:cupin domain-containing protein [bacterium]